MQRTTCWTVKIIALSTTILAMVRRPTPELLSPAERARMYWRVILFVMRHVVRQLWAILTGKTILMRGRTCSRGRDGFLCQIITIVLFTKNIEHEQRHAYATEPNAPMLWNRSKHGRSMAHQFLCHMMKQRYIYGCCISIYPAGKRDEGNASPQAHRPSK